MAVILGLSFFYHDSSAAIVIGGVPVAAVAEERLCRRKHTNEFPELAIAYCLQQAGLPSIREVDAVVFYERPVSKFSRILESALATWPRSWEPFVRGLPRYLRDKLNVRRVLRKRLSGFDGHMLFVEHHLSHAAAAFYPSGYEDAAILTVDGVGEWETTCIGQGHGATLSLDKTIHFPHSVGLLYSALTSYLGFRVNDGEWKVMGLAPYGKPRYLEAFRKLFRTLDDGSYRLDMRYFKHHWSYRWTYDEARWHALFGFGPRGKDQELSQEHEDLARSGQEAVEEIILGLAREAKRHTQSDNLVIAGGVGLNCVANWRIEREGIFRNVWIQPAAGDDGGALGAALYVAHHVLGERRAPRMQHAYLGPAYSDEQIEAALREVGARYVRHDATELPWATARLLAEGKVVGWFHGRMEFGPRALGSRSILADATNPQMKDIINRKIKYREYFRPFAPVVPLEHVHDYFDVGAGTELPFMLKTPQVRADKRASLPAITHEDGSGRVQTVTAESNGAYYQVVKAFGQLRGVPVLINTSFNVRGEPIVCTPRNAWDCFVQTGMDALVMGSFIVTEKPRSVVDDDAGYRRSDRLEKDVGVQQMTTT